jgi:predicted MFS family arabinose efflux permease
MVAAMISGPASSLRYAIGGMFAMAVAMGIGRFVYTPILPGMMDGIGLSASDVGLIASANYLGYLIGAFAAAGGWAHGYERAVMLSGLVASAILAGVMGLTDSVALFIVIRFLAGLASAFVLVFVTTIVFSRLASASREGLQAVHFAGVAVGIAASSLMTGALVLDNADWPAGWLWAGALSVIGAVIVAGLVREGPVVAGPAHREPPLPRSAALTRIIVAYGLFGFGYIVTATFLVAIVRQGEGGRLFESAVWLVTGLAGVPSVYLWNRAARRWGLAGTFAIACVVEAVGVAASVGLGGYAGPLLGGILLGGTFIAITALGLQTGRLLAPLAPRRSLALMTTSFGIGQIFGPIVAGFVADWAGDFVLASLLAAAVLLVAAVIVSPVDASTNSP